MLRPPDIFASFVDRDMFARYAGIGVGHHAQYNLPMLNTGRSTMWDEPLLPADEPDIYNGDEDDSETDEERTGNGDLEEETGDDDDDGDDNDDDDDDGNDEDGNDEDGNDDGDSDDDDVFEF